MYFVTGATGFLGRHLLDYVASLPAQQRVPLAVLVRSAAKGQALVAAYENLAITPIEGSLDAPASWRESVASLSPQGVFHLAAEVAHGPQADDTIQRVNVAGSHAVATLAHALGARLILLSSSGCVACSHDVTSMPSEQAPYALTTAMAWPYYASKVAAEQQALRACLQLGKLVILRPPMLHGPGDTRWRSTRTVIRFLRGKVPFALAGQIAIADVRDVAQAAWRAMQLPAPAPIYHLPGHALSLADYFGLLAEVAHMKAPRFVLPRPAAVALAHASELLHRCLPKLVHKPFIDSVTVAMAHCAWGLSSTVAEADLGYVARPLRETLADTVAYLRAHHPDCRPQRKE